MLSKTMRVAVAVVTAAALVLGGASASYAQSPPTSGEDPPPAVADSSLLGAGTRSIQPPLIKSVLTAIPAKYGAVQAGYLPPGDGTPGRVLYASKFVSSVPIVDAETGRATVAPISLMKGANGLAVAPGSTSSAGFVYIAEDPGTQIAVYDIALEEIVRRIDVPMIDAASLLLVGGAEPGTGVLYMTSQSAPKIIGIDVVSGEVLRTILLPNNYERAAITRGGDAKLDSGSLLVSDVGEVGEILRVDIGSGAVLKSYPFYNGFWRDDYRSMEFVSGSTAGDERILVTRQNTLGGAAEVDLATGAVVATYKSGLVGTGKGVGAVSYASDTDKIYVYPQYDPIGVFHRGSSEKTIIDTLGSPQGGVGVIGTSPGTGQGTLYLADRLMRSGGPVINVYDTTADKLIKSYSIGSGEVAPTAMTVLDEVTPRLVTYNGGYVKLRNIDTGQFLSQYLLPNVDFMTPLSSSVTGTQPKLLVSSVADKSLRLVNATSGAVEWQLPLGYAPNGSAYVAGDTLAESRIYVASPNTGTVEVLNAETKTLVASYTGFVKPKYVAVRPSGQLVVLEQDGTLRVSETSGTHALAAEPIEFGGSVSKPGYGAEGLVVSEIPGTGDAKIYAADQTVGLAISTIHELAITPETLPVGIVGLPYEAEINAHGNLATTLTLSAGALPVGLRIDSSSGKITGTPSKAGDYSFTITASNEHGSVSKTFALSVKSALEFETNTLPDGVLNTGYNQVVSVKGDKPIAVKITKGALPDGLVLDQETGKISGKPTKTGSFSFSLTAVNGIAPNVEKGYKIAIRAAVIPDLPAPPKVDPSDGTKVTGSAEPGSTLTIRDAKGKTTCTTQANKDTGRFSCKLVPSLKDGAKVTATATTRAGTSKPVTITVKGTAVPPLPCALTRNTPVFADTPLGHKFYKEIDWMECMKYSTGWKQATGKPVYKPADNLSRAAMAAFIFRMEGDKNYKAPKVSPFADMKPGDKFYREISWMWEAKLSTGNREASGKPTYRPNEDLSREAMAAFIYRLEAKSDASVKNFTAPKVSAMADMKPGMKFYKEIAWMYDAKLTTGNKVGSLREYWPKDKLSRQAMAAFIYRLVTDYRK